MTVPTAAAASPTQEELLVQEAIRQRTRYRSGKSLAALIALAVFLGVAGYLMALHPGTMTYDTPYSSSFPLGALLSVFGFAELLAAVLLVVTAVQLARSGAAWGDPAAGDCPLCGQAALRQDEVLLREGNTLNTRASGTVIACGAPGCGYASAEAAGPAAHQG
ncbi:MAG TPA: hypothetical protein VMG38_15320 [Trebonia sp.]|nr:hypothetical protein [Trebonia sp.]